MKPFTFFILAAATSVAAAGAQTAAQSPRTPEPGIVHQTLPAIYRFQVGKARVTALSDGTVPIDLHSLLRGADASTVDRLLSRSFLGNPAEASINAFLVELGARRILVDVGAGELFGPGNGGRLPEALAAAGVGPEEITDILITHVHTDHSGGLVRGQQMLFPNATVHAGGADVRLFLDPAKAGTHGYDKRYWTETARTLKPYADAGRVTSIDTDGEIIPGIRAELHPGHTPGSAFYTLTSEGRSIVFIGDLIHVGAVQFPRPDITITFDFDQAAARTQRARSFARFARDANLIAAPHLPFPGTGHIVPDGRGYRWIPVDYSDRQAGGGALNI